MKLNLIPLGINGFFPSHNRQTACYMIQNGQTIIILDAGTGIARLIEPELKKIVDEAKKINIILSHYHLDHIVGLSYLPGICQSKAVSLFAPVYPLIETKLCPEDILYRLLSKPIYSLNLNDLGITIIPIRDNFNIDGLHISVRPQKHPSGSIGIRINNSLAYITDTIVDYATVDFTKNVHLLLHETWLTDLEAQTSIEADGALAKEKHSWVSGVKKIATLSNVTILAPIHHQPQRTNTEIEDIIKTLSFNSTFQTINLKEGSIYTIP